MASRLIALSMTVFLLSSVLAAPASAQAAEDPKQPSVDNPHMHFWGTSDLGSCWTHFDSNDSTGSAEEGYGVQTFSQGQQVEVMFTCRTQENFKENMYLSPNGTIVVEIGVKIYSDDCSGQGTCKNLTMTLFKGNIEVAIQEFPSVDNSYNDEQIRWEIPVNGNMTSWNKSQEEPALQVEYSKPGYNGGECLLPIIDCTGEFMFYYSNNEDGMTAEVNFPVINMTDAVDPDGEGDGDDDDGSLPGGLPGFGLMAGLGALAIAAVSANQRTEQE